MEKTLSRPLLVDDTLIPRDLRFSLHRNTSARKSHQVVLHASTDRIIVQAANFAPSGASSAGGNDAGTHYALAVIEMDSEGEPERVEIVDAEMLHCRRYVKSLSQHYARHQNSAALAEDEAPPPAVDYKTARMLLGESFGTRKQRTAISSTERNQIDVQALKTSSAAFISRAIRERAEDALETPPDSRAATPILVDADRDAQHRQYEELLPPHDPSAGSPASIYTLDGLLPPDIRAILPIESFTDDAFDENIPLLSPFVAEKMRQARGSEDRVALALLLHYLFVFRGLREGQLNSQSALHAALTGVHDPQVFASFLLSRFADCVVVQAAGSAARTRYKLPATHRDRLAVWIAVTCLLLDALRTNITQLSIALQLSPLKTASYFRSAGCVIDRPAKGEPSTIIASDGRALQIKWARLKAPLDLPKPSLGKRGRK